MATLVGNIRGPQGLPGQDGAQGEQGPPGQDGAAGATGPQGETGPQGPAGTGINPRGALDDPSELPEQDNEIGDAYLIAGDMWVWTEGGWVNFGSLQGPAGPTGPPGADGAPGTPGAPGQDGAPGAPGPRGTGWFAGVGSPQEPIAGSVAGDLYLDVGSGNVYELAGA